MRFSGRKPLNVAFLWHMHQPPYKDPLSNRYILPWTRLHGVKDYYDMGALLQESPGVKVTFNFVPSLLEQLNEYGNGQAVDEYLEHTTKRAAELTDQEKKFILINFFHLNFKTMLEPHGRYRELLKKRGDLTRPGEIELAQNRFKTQDFLDLQVWFNLAWCGEHLKKDPFISALIKKGRNYDEAEKDELIRTGQKHISSIIPLYKELLTKGQVELTTSPYYHPILPLLVDLNSARMALPGISLPSKGFRFKNDAKLQLEKALSLHREIFGRQPDGIWPPEGSVSEEIMPLLAEMGIKWIATDEGVLSRSSSRSGNTLPSRSRPAPDVLYRPYSVDTVGRLPLIFFRDRFLSDLIGFTYYSWSPYDAASDFISRLIGIWENLPADGKDYIVPIILDGENAWEYYQHNGVIFLRELYKRLSSEERLKSVTFGEFAEKCQDAAGLSKLHAGSWISSSFEVWVGHEEKNQAWDYLARAREYLEAAAAKISGSGEGSQVELEKAMNEILAAEGSDWFWWFGDNHATENGEQFDLLFRDHLKAMYSYLQSHPPAHLNQPIKKISAPHPSRDPTGLIAPVLDGKATDYYEWLSAGYFKVSPSSYGAMQRGQRIVDSIYYGFDKSNFYLRIDFSGAHNFAEEKLALSIHFLRPEGLCAELKPRPETGHYELLLHSEGPGSALSSFGVKRIVEIALPLKELNTAQGDRIKFYLVVESGGAELDRWPSSGAATVDVWLEDTVEVVW